MALTEISTLTSKAWLVCKRLSSPAELNGDVFLKGHGMTKKHIFVILYVNKKTKEVEMKATCKTKPMSLEEARELAKKEVKKTQKMYKQYAIAVDFM